MIRAANEKDVDAIARLWLGLVQHHRSLDAAMPEASEDGEIMYARRLTERIDDPHTHVVVAEEGDRLVAFALGVIIDLVPEMFKPEMAGFVADIYVRPDYRRRGIGRGLVDALKDWFRSKGIDHFEWYVAARNEESRSFWQALGGRDVMVRMRADIEIGEQ